MPSEDIALETFSIPLEHPKLPNGPREYREVLCGSKMTTDFINALAKSLWIKGYDIPDKE